MSSLVDDGLFFAKFSIGSKGGCKTLLLRRLAVPGRRSSIYNFYFYLKMSWWQAEYDNYDFIKGIIDQGVHLLLNLETIP